MRSRRTPCTVVPTPALRGVSTTVHAEFCRAPESGTPYGTFSLASSDRPLSFPRKSTADTE
jgi:hypothetical protein